MVFSKRRVLSTCIALAVALNAAYDLVLTEWDGRYDNYNDEGRSLQIATPDELYDYYDYAGADGACLDDAGQEYGRQSFLGLATVGKCAIKCSHKILAPEHVGYEFTESDSDGNAICHCLWEGGGMPPRSAVAYTNPSGSGTDFGKGTGAVHRSTGGTSGFRCYKSKYFEKFDASSWYTEDNSCEDLEKENYDVVTWSQPSEGGCKEKCVRFALYSFHSGFRYDDVGETCECLFEVNRAPKVAVLPPNSAREKRNAWSATSTGNAWTCGSNKAWVNPSPLMQVNITELSAKWVPQVWINEIHYRGKGTVKPFIEIIGPANFIPTGYKVLLYQGRNGKLFRTAIELGVDEADGVVTGTLSEGLDNGWGFYTIFMDEHAIRDGKMNADGIALTYNDECVQFISYENTGLSNTFLATAGACNNIASTAMGVYENRSPANRESSLQLTGSPGGQDYTSYTWTGPIHHTQGAKNTGQVLPVYQRQEA